jgi:hypothetical protein
MSGLLLVCAVLSFLDKTGRYKKSNALALIASASPDLEKQGCLAVVFVNRE